MSKKKSTAVTGEVRSALVVDVDPSKHPQFPDMRDLLDTLHFNPAEGRIWLGGRRMVLLHTEAIGALRQELIASMGINGARGLLTRMGYLSGSRDAQLALKVRASGDVLDAFAVGPQLHALEGVVSVEPIKLEMDSARGHFYGEFLWRNSSEDDSHIAAYGHGSEPACWMQLGYACGYTSTFMGKLIIYRELECRAMGQDSCRIVGKPAEEWDDVEVDLTYLEAQQLAKHTQTTSAPNVSIHPIAPSLDVADEGAIGASAGFFGVIHKIHRVASTDATVLFLGESGVGKSMFARVVHQKSTRASRPFLQVNCAAIPEQLVESELFGVEKGAFTGASESRAGRFEMADSGTLFLDEISTLSLTAQGKLLRVLQSGELEHLGSTTTRKVNVRVIAASNENLQTAVLEGRFRGDLFYRLNVFPIHIPPLRERKDDITLLLDHLLKRYSTRHKRKLAGITNRAMRFILAYDWPGNVRELENVIERGVILADNDSALDVSHLFTVSEKTPNAPQIGLSELGMLIPAEPPETASLSNASDAPKAALREWAKKMVRHQNSTLGQVEEALVGAALEQAQGNVSKASALLGISRAQMDYRAKKRGPE
jgi:two-component system, NtrC family, response regulator HydG